MAFLDSHLFPFYITLKLTLTLIKHSATSSPL